MALSAKKVPNPTSNVLWSMGDRHFLFANGYFCFKSIFYVFYEVYAFMLLVLCYIEIGF